MMEEFNPGDEIIFRSFSGDEWEAVIQPRQQEQYADSSPRLPVIYLTGDRANGKIYWPIVANMRHKVPEEDATASFFMS